MEAILNKLVLLVLLLAPLLAACGAAPEPGLPLELSVDEAYGLYEQGTYFLDVRSPDEWNEFHAPNSTLIPLNELADRLNEVPRDQTVVVVCRSGNRSSQARDLLLEAGFTQVTSMRGGLSEWAAKGYPGATGP
jgi:rhodanese-related sulfurtransferase